MPKMLAPQVATDLRRRIDAGEWLAGEILPPERVLADSYGVARNTMRRAVAQLRQDGTLVSEVGRGTFLASRSDDALGAIMARMGGTSPADMMDVRLMLEPEAAALAAVSGSVADTDAIAAAHQAAVEAINTPGFEECDADFHQRVVECTGNDFLKDLHNLICHLRRQPQWYDLKRRTMSVESQRLYCEQHEAVLAALRRRDSAGAKAAMEEHLLAVRRNLLGR